jgi:signal transduction histidine kinase
LCIEVADQCGGLPPGRAEELFTPLVQRHGDRSGFGLGLAIVLQAAEAHGGTAKVHDVPHVGCVFSLDLPLLHELPGPATGS